MFAVHGHFPVYGHFQYDQFSTTPGVNLTVRPRYVVFDDTLEDRTLGCTADQFAEALRSPLGKIGVRVVRQRSIGSTSSLGGFQVRGCTRSQYNTMLDMVDRVVNGVIDSLSDKTEPIILGAQDLIVEATEALA
jgi:hypothetical protein